jgi:Fusaric acid resistance protein-like
VTATSPEPGADSGAVDTAGFSEKPSGGWRVVQILGALLVAVVLPVVLMHALAGKLGAAAMILGVLLGVLGGKIGGTRRMLYLAVAAGLGAITAYDWSWVALLAVVGVIIGAGIRFGWLGSLLMIGFAATFATATSSAKDAVWYGVIVGIGTLYGVVLARRFKAPEIVEGQRVPVRTAILVAIVFGVGMGATAAIGVALGWTEPDWVPEPILLLTLYILMGKRERIREKAIGTAVGVIAVVPVAIVAPSAVATSVIAGVAFLLSFAVFSKLYWLYYALFTFALVLVLAPPGHAGSEAGHRGSEILIGIGILVVGLAIIHALGNWLSKRYPEPELA